MECTDWVAGMRGMCVCECSVHLKKHFLKSVCFVGWLFVFFMPDLYSPVVCLISFILFMVLSDWYHVCTDTVFWGVGLKIND